jgi:hypothetical protein
LVNLIHQGLDVVEAAAANPIAGGIPLGQLPDDELLRMVTDRHLQLPEPPTRQDMIDALEAVL